MPTTASSNTSDAASGATVRRWFDCTVRSVRVAPPVRPQNGQSTDRSAALVDPLGSPAIEVGALYCEVVLDHHCDKLLEPHLGAPVEQVVCFGAVADKQVDL